MLANVRTLVKVSFPGSKSFFEVLSLKKTGLFLNPDILLEAIYFEGRKPAFFTKFRDSLIEFVEIAATGTVLLVEESPIAIKISFSLAFTFNCSEKIFS